MRLRRWLVELLRDWADWLEEKRPEPTLVACFMPELWEVDAAYREMVQRERPAWHDEAMATLEVRA